MVVPAELLHVVHASPVRRFLVNECRRVLVVDPRGLLFEKTLQGVVLVMAEKKSSCREASEGVSIISMADNDFLVKDPEAIFEKAAYAPCDGKWTKLLLSPAESAILDEAPARSSIRRFKEIASAALGIITGSNAFFVVDRRTVSKYDLSRFARPALAKSEHCPGVVYDEALHRENEAKGFPTSLICFGRSPFDALPQKVRQYIAMGEEQQLHTRQKCRIRTPWYSVPSVYRTELGMTKCSHQYPRLIVNSACAYTTTAAYRVAMISREVAPVQLAFSFINSLTALSCELEGRAYGGGVLELVPSEIEELLVPIGDATLYDLEILNAKITNGVSADVLLREQDEIILKSAGLTGRERAIIHEAWDRISTRRHRTDRRNEETHNTFDWGETLSGTI
jgi:adenine-specific DNA methylase